MVISFDAWFFLYLFMSKYDVFSYIICWMHWTSQYLTIFDTIDNENISKSITETRLEHDFIRGTSSTSLHIVCLVFLLAKCFDSGIFYPVCSDFCSSPNAEYDQYNNLTMILMWYLTAFMGRTNFYPVKNFAFLREPPCWACTSWCGNKLANTVHCWVRGKSSTERLWLLEKKECIFLIWSSQNHQLKEYWAHWKMDRFM